MSEITVPGIADRVATEVPKFFRDGIDQVIMGEGAYIATGEPQGQVGKIGQAVARSYCRQYGANPSAAKFGNAVRIENACRPYLDGLNPGDGPTVRIPFRGGQCAFLYTLTYSYNVILTDGTLRQPPDVRTRTLLGPLANFRGEGLPEFQSIRITELPSNDVQLRSGSCPQGCYANVTLVSLVRQDGQPDNCGNQPPAVTQPNPSPDPTGPNFQFNPDADIDIDIGVDVNPDGTIDVDIGTGPITIDPFPPEDTPGDDGTPGDEPGDVGEPDPEPEDTGDDGTASGCAGENQVLGGLKIAITATPDNATQYSPGIYRGAGYIYMGVEDNLDQDFGGSMMRDGQFFLPEKENLTCWEVRANIGYRFSVTPYYKEVPPPEE